MALLQRAAAPGRLRLPAPAPVRNLGTATIRLQPRRGGGSLPPARSCLLPAARNECAPPAAGASASSASAPACSVSRRAVGLGGAAGLVGLGLGPWPQASGAAAAAKPAGSSAGDWSSPGLAAPVDPDAPKFVKTASGVRYQDVGTGTGPVAQPGDSVLFDYVLRRSNGYFIYATVEGASFQPRDVPVGPVSFTLGSGELIPGLEEVLVGMAAGGKRRALVPPAAGYAGAAPGGAQQPQPPTFATRRQLENHRAEPLLFELQLLRVRGQK